MQCAVMHIPFWSIQWGVSFFMGILCFIGLCRHLFASTMSQLGTCSLPGAAIYGTSTTRFGGNYWIQGLFFSLLVWVSSVCHDTSRDYWFWSTIGNKKINWTRNANNVITEFWQAKTSRFGIGTSIPHAMLCCPSVHQFWFWLCTPCVDSGCTSASARTQGEDLWRIALPCLLTEHKLRSAVRWLLALPYLPTRPRLSHACLCSSCSPYDLFLKEDKMLAC